MNRNLSTAGLTGAALTTLTGLAVEVVVKPATDVSDQQWSYPWTSGPFVAVSIGYAVLHLLVFLGMLAVLRALTSRTARIGAGIAAAGTLVLLLAEIASIPIADQRLDDTGAQVIGAFFGAGVALTAIGLLTAGIAVLRSNDWTGWQRYVPLGAGVWSLVLIGLSMTSALPLGVAVYGLTLCALFLAVRTLHTPTEPRTRARVS
ncbi:hypothetical protein AB0E69_25760 [Kribbella sp. NPDC026611]|uniref:hypothetical protein n=1 Tax=Kribbella sp. NPDC026611 TaxID=3154911 RepID=UPI0033F09438